MKRKITLLIGAAVSLGCLYLVFKDLDLREFGRSLAAVDPLWLLASLAFFYLSMFLRGVRWALLFRPAHRISGVSMFRPIMICFAFNSIMPGRVGEVVRAFFVSRRDKTGLPAALATVVSERIFDAVTLLLLLAGSLAMLPEIDPNLVVSVGKYSIDATKIETGMAVLIRASLVLVGGVVFVLLPGVERRLVALVRALPAVPQGLSAKAAEIIQGIIRGFEAVRDPRNLALIAFHSLSIWALVGASNLALAKGFGGMEKLNAMHAMAMVSLIAIFIVIPAAPGYWGLFEAGAIFSLKVLGVSPDDTTATAFAIVMHLVQYVPIVVVGLFFAAQSHVRAAPVEEASAGE